MKRAGDSFDLCNEFAAVRVSRDDRANGPRLRIEDLRTGRVMYFDPLELEWLSWSSHADLMKLMPVVSYGSEATPGGYQ